MGRERGFRARMEVAEETRLPVCKLVSARFERVHSALPANRVDERLASELTSLASTAKITP